MAQQSLRAYQQEAVDKAVNSRGNTLIVLPTGAGKTKIAAQILLRTGPPCLFLVPSVPLVGQQARALRNECPGWNIAELSGEGQEPWKDDRGQPAKIHVLVATAGKFLSDYGLMSQIEQKNLKEPFSFFNSVSLVIFDEVHHTLGEHTYAQIARCIFPSALATQLSSAEADRSYSTTTTAGGSSVVATSQQRTGPMLNLFEKTPQIVGLTAQPTYKKTDGTIQNAVADLFHVLRFSEYYTASNLSLIEGGYKKGWGEDMSRRKFQSYDIHIQQQRGEGSARDIWKNPSPHARMEAYLTAGRQGEYMGVIAENDHTSFVQLVVHLENFLLEKLWQIVGQPKPISRPPISALLAINDSASEENLKSDDEKSLAVSEWGKVVKAAADKLGESSGDLAILEHWYEPLRLAAVGGPDAIDLALHYLSMNHPGMSPVNPSFSVVDQTLRVLNDLLFHYNLEDDESASEEVYDLMHGLRTFNREYVVNTPRPRLEQLLTELQAKERTMENKNLKAIVFVENKLTTIILRDYIRKSSSLAAEVAFSANGRATPTYTMTKTTLSNTLDQFRVTPQSMVIISTNVWEEGVDVPDANVVVRFDEVMNTVSQVQAGGRARDPEDGLELALLNSGENLERAALVSREKVRTFFDSLTPEQRDWNNTQNAHRANYIASQFSPTKLDRYLALPEKHSNAVSNEEDGLPHAVFEVDPDHIQKNLLQQLVEAGSTKTPLSYLSEQANGKKLERFLSMKSVLCKHGPQSATVVVTLTSAPNPKKVLQGSPRWHDLIWSCSAKATAEGRITQPRYGKPVTHEKIAQHACVDHILQEKELLEPWCAGLIYPQRL